MNKHELLHGDITSKVIDAFYNVYNQLGHGFLEKVYRKAMMIELAKMGLDCQQEVPVRVYYDEHDVGLFYADIVINNIVIVELKAPIALVDKNVSQLVNLLKATDIEVGMLLNFGENPKYERKIFTADFKWRNQQKTSGNT